MGELERRVGGSIGTNLIACLASAYATLSNKTIIVNGRLAPDEVALAGTRVEFSVWGRNITNRLVELYDISISPVGNQVSFYNEPRTDGVEARLRF